MVEEGQPSRDLLEQLNLILERDKFIDEIGFLHPSQFATLNENSGDLVNPADTIEKSADNIYNSGVTTVIEVEYDKMVFWNSNHKLAVSIQVLPQLYNAAKRAYIDASKSYKEFINTPIKRSSFNNATAGANFVHFLESEILKYTKVVLILSCDFNSAWNSRKLVLSRNHIFSLYIYELQLTKLILSYSPKSAYAWSHRRWVIKMIVEQVQNMGTVEKEAALVKEIAEKTKMNYRAWNHLCWLVQYMTKAQVIDELNKSRKWSEFHVADNCCFHYLRRLMLRMLEVNFVKEDAEASNSYKSDISFEWKEELKWNELLIGRYIGREALWVHRRFLAQCWIKHSLVYQEADTPHFEGPRINPALDAFLENELRLSHTFLNTQCYEFEDTQLQARHATSYILWISKQIPLPQMSVFGDKLRDIGKLKEIMIKGCPDKSRLWESLF